MAALEELKLHNGDIKVNGSIAYAAQQPWIFSGTVRQNILFGKEYNNKKYKTVIKACDLISVASFSFADVKDIKCFVSQNILGLVWVSCQT